MVLRTVIFLGSHSILNSIFLDIDVIELYNLGRPFFEYAAKYKDFQYFLLLPYSFYVLVS
jgi:hypothetical protein